MRKTFFGAILFFLFLTFNLNAQSTNQTLTLKQGFNFISFTVQPTITADQLKQNNISLIDDIYHYSATAGSFLSVSEGTLTSISSGKGYIIKTKTEGSLLIDGSAVSTQTDLLLKAGFNLIGISQTITSTNFSNLIRTYGIIKGLYKWSPTAGSFIQVVKDYNGTPQLIDAVDPQLKSGESYFLNAYDNTTLSFSGGSISLIGGTIPVNSDVPASVLSDLPATEQTPGYGNIEGEISPTYTAASPINRIMNIASLSNIKVWIKNHPEINTFTESNGKFILKNVPAAAKGSGHTIEYEKNEGEEVFKGVVKDVPVIEKKKIDLKPYIGPSVIKKTGGIIGKIALSDGLSPLGAEIYIPAISGLITKADEDGTFNLLYIPEGEFNLVAYANGYEILKTKVIINAGEIKNLSTILLNKKVLASTESFIDGFIMDNNSAPVANANLSLLSEDSKIDLGTSTTITGHYRFNNVPAGKYKIIVTKDQFIGLNTEETILAGQTKYLNISLKKSQAIINTYAMVSGKLIMKGSNIPLRNAIIITAPPTQQYFTDFDGTFNFLLPAGSSTVYKIICKKAGYLDFSSEISLKAEESVSIQDILLQPLTNDLIPTSLDLNIPTLTLKEGDSLQLTATVKDNSGNILTGQKIDWSVNNSNGFISLSGLFNAIKAGDVEITAKCADITKTINAKIEANSSIISQLKITSESIGFETGKVYKFNLVAVTNDGKITIIPASMATWEISPLNSNIIINEGSLISSAAYNGIVKVTYNQQSASKLINIVSAVADLTPPTISHIPPALKPVTPLEIKCIVTDNKNVEKAILYFKKASSEFESSPWSSIPMDRIITTENNYSNEYSYIIPASFITTAGIKYYIAANDMNQNKSYYPTEGELKPVILLPASSGYVSTIKGRVIITGTNTPISDAQVIFSAGEGIITKTDGSGNFVINGQFTAGLYSLTSTKLGKIGEKSIEITQTQYGTEIADLIIEMEQPKLTKIEIEKTQDQIGINQKYDLSKLSVTAYYDNGQTRLIIPKWLADKGTIENLLYSPLAQIYTATLIASYTENGINKISNLILNVVNEEVKILSAISLSITSENILSSFKTYDLSKIVTNALYSDGTSKIITPSWAVYGGDGTISNFLFYLPTDTNNVILNASYLEQNITKTAELSLSISTNETPQTVATPIISPGSGTFSLSQLITISCTTENAIIKYTLDGSIPSATNGLIYSSPFTITQSTTIKAIAIKASLLNSALISVTYSFNNISESTLNIDLGDGIILELVKIPSGTFQMGSPNEELNRLPTEGPAHTVNITKDFYMGKYEVTQGQWIKITGIVPDNGDGVGTNLPVYYLSWNDCQSFITILNQKDYSKGLGKFRLPTEAEWEYACRANTTTPYYWGETMDNYYCWYSSNSASNVHPVGSTLAGLNSPNAFGLYDMSGNVMEWCNDWFGPYSADTLTDPLGPSSGTYRVIRGGAFVTNATYCRSAFRRETFKPTEKSSSNGFRVVLANEYSLTGKVEVPIISKLSGTYYSTLEIKLSSTTPEATIKYTIDGTIPSPSNGYIYTSEIVISSSTMLKTFAFKTEMADSEIATAIYSVFVPPKESPVLNIDLGDGVMLQMAKIPAGTFQMGSPDYEEPDQRYANEGPIHTVTLTKDYYMGKFEVTQKQWTKIMTTNPATNNGVGDDYPVYNVSWDDCQRFITKLNQNGFSQGNGIFRLPTEAEWEYACRAKTTTAYYWPKTGPWLLGLRIGDDDYCWYSHNSGDTPHPVGQKYPNNFGLFDMSGNILEWCNDWFGFYNSEAAIDPQGPTSGTYRMLRGGSWASPYYNGISGCRSASRSGYSKPNFWSKVTGFRLVLQ